MITMLEFLSLALALSILAEYTKLNWKYNILAILSLLIGFFLQENLIAWILYFFILIYYIYYNISIKLSKRIDEEYEKLISRRSTISTNKEENSKHEKVKNNV